MDKKRRKHEPIYYRKPKRKSHTVCNVEMVQQPVRESRHVAIYDLNSKITNERIRKYFAKKGGITNYNRLEGSQDVIHITFQDLQLAADAHAITQFEDATPCRVVYTEGGYTKPKIVYPGQSVACVIFDVEASSTEEREVFDAVKAFSKRHGQPIDIHISISHPGHYSVAVHFWKFHSDSLKADRNEIFGKPPKFRIHRAIPSTHPSTAPSTSRPAEIPSISVHVPNRENHDRKHFEQRFKRYGTVAGVELVKPKDRDPLAIIHFADFESARRAHESEPSKPPPFYRSRNSTRLILFNLPSGKEGKKNGMMMIVRAISTKIKNIELDEKCGQAVLHFSTNEDAKSTYDQIISGGCKALKGSTSVATDFCSDMLSQFFTARKAAELADKRQASSSTPPPEAQDRKRRKRTQSSNSPTTTLPKESQVSDPRVSTSTDAGPSTNKDKEQRESPKSSPEYDYSSEDENGEKNRNGTHNPTSNHHTMPSSNGPVDDMGQSPTYDCNSPFDLQGSSHDQPEPSQAPSPEPERKHSNASPVHSSSPLQYREASNDSKEEPVPNKRRSGRRRRRRLYSSSDRSSASPSEPMSPQEDILMKMVNEMDYNQLDISKLPTHLESTATEIWQSREAFEKTTVRHFPKFTRESDLKCPNHLQYEYADSLIEEKLPNESDVRFREWTRIGETELFEEFRLPEPKQWLNATDTILSASTSRIIPRQSLEETRGHRLSLDLAHHPHELAQRSQSLCIGPTTPVTPFHANPLLVNTAFIPGLSQPGPSGAMTPRSAQPAPIASPVSRHGSMSSTVRPANIQAMRHHSVMFPPDLSIPPPPVPPTHDEMHSLPPTRRSSETLIPIPNQSPSLTRNIPQLLSMPLTMPPNLMAGTATGTHSVSSSATSTPRHSISGTPIHHEPPTPKIPQQPPTPKTSRPEKVQVRHDSISKPGPSTAASALQARSQSMSVPDPKKSVPTTPVVRDAGSDLIDQIMSNQPSMGFKKLPRIEKKSSALHNSLQSQQQNVSSTTPGGLPNAQVTTPISHAMLIKEKEKEKRRKERELEKEREARKEMKRKETKEERHKRKEMERAKREEEERRERKREKQKMKEKEERRREKEKEKEREKEKEKEKERERKKAEKEKLKKKNKRRDEDSDRSDSGSGDDEEYDLNTRKSNKEMTQEEKDHQLALILSKGSIIENLKSRRRTDTRGHESFEKLRQKNQNSLPRRVLIESSDDDDGGGDDDDDDEDEDDEKEKSGASSVEGSDTEQRFLLPPPMPISVPTPSVKDHKPKVHKEREKGELSSSDDEETKEEEKRRELEQKKIRDREDRENRKRQKSMTNYSSDDHNERGGKSAMKKKKRDDSEERARKAARESKEHKQRKRKLEHRLSSDNETKRNAKRDFRDVPLEDVSDEEEVEDVSRVRRPSTSSVASASNEKKSSKTPLRVTTPSVTPLQSPKILSPKILSPKTSSSSIKRPSISEESLASLTSPKPRNRTTSSTSTATTGSRHDTIPEKPISPAVTAKSSVSSIDDLAIREDLSATSAAASPMSATGRPMVVTKAAMKVFHPSPPKKQRKPTAGQHEASSPSSGSDDSSSSSDSSDDSSDGPAEQPTDKLSGVHVEAAVSQNRDETVNFPAVVPLLIPPPPIPPLIPPPPPPPILDVPVPAETVQAEESKEPVVEPVSEAPISSVESEKQGIASQDSIDLLKQSPDGSEHDQEAVADEAAIADDDVKLEEKPEAHEKILEAVEEPEPVVVAETPSFEKSENDDVVHVVVENVKPQEQQDVPEQHETASAQPQSLISDQETDNAVQSIFNEEDEEDFPHYPDFVMPKDQKDEPKQEDDQYSPLTSNSNNVEQDNAVASIIDENGSPVAGNHHNYNNFNEEKQKELLQLMSGSEGPLLIDDAVTEIVETECEVPMEDMVVQDVVEDVITVPNNSEEAPTASTQLIANHSRQSEHEETPTPELIPNDAVHEDRQTGGRDELFQQHQPTPVLQSPSHTNSTEPSTSTAQPTSVAQLQHPHPSPNHRSSDADVQQRLQGTPQSQKHGQENDARQSNMEYFAGMSREELAAAIEREGEEAVRAQHAHVEEVRRYKKAIEQEDEQERNAQMRLQQPTGQQRNVPQSAVPTRDDERAAALIKFVNPDAWKFFEKMNLPFNRSHFSPVVVKAPQSSSSSHREKILPNGATSFQKWFYKACTMSTDEPSSGIATAPSATATPMASTADLAAMLQQIQAVQAAQAQVPVVTTASAPNPLVNSLEAILNTASLANLAAGGPLNPLSMLALTSSLNQSSPVYQGIARVLLTMNMGQMLATQQTSELLATMNQQDPLMALLAARGGMPFQLPAQQQQQLQQQGVFAVPQVPQIPHMSLKRNNKEQLAVGGSDRKKSCPPLAMIGGGGHQGQPTPPTQPVAAPPPAPAPVAPRSPSPPRKSMFENLTPEMKEKNEMFRKEILRRLDIILLEELGTEDEEEDKKSEPKQIPTSDEDDTDDSKTESMGAAGSAFRRILSRSSTMGNNSGSPSASGTTSPSTGSLSSGSDSPPLERDPLNAEFLEMLSTVAQKHKQSAKFDGLSSETILDEALFVQKFPMMWTGRLALKSMETSINLHYLTGREQFLKDALGNATVEEKPHRDLVRITQRLRLDNGQIEHIHRILTDPDFACCIGLYSSSDIDGLAAGENLQNSLIDYLNKKQIAGISCLDSGNDLSTARVHVFAPGPLVSQYLTELCPTLLNYIQSTRVGFLFIVFTNDKMEPNMVLPSTPSEIVVE